MKIINIPCLPYRVIGQVIDEYIDKNYEDTCYVGKIEYFEIEYKKEKYKVQIRYLKTFVEWRFDYYEQ